MNMSSALIVKLLLFATLFLGLVLRIWHINFGLPHSWYADETEIGEPAIKYTYEIKNIIKNNDVYKLVPQSYVYGTFPVYFYTLTTMLFSKTMGILEVNFSKTDLYVFMRVINALISFSLIPVFYFLLKSLELTNKPLISLLGLFLVAFNWKLIVHAHYLNHDIVITLLITLANLSFYKYLKQRHTAGKMDGDTVYTFLFAVSFGLAVSTKITSLITLPLYLVIFAVNRDFKNLLGSALLVIGVFMVTNPFSWLLWKDFIGRIMEMRIKEAGMVFDSVNYSPFKYVQALSWMLTLPILLASCLGVASLFKRFRLPTANGTNIEKTRSHLKQFLILMLSQVVFYFIFFSLQNRRVDRWMLPILPNLALFSLYALDHLTEMTKTRVYRKVLIVLLGITITYYLYFPAILTSQFQRQTPKSAAYIWAKENLTPTSTKFGITEEGLDPMNKLPNATIWQFNAYESEGAQFIYPPDPILYDYIIISSRPMSWVKNPEVAKKHPLYAKKWEDFTDRINDTNIFKPVKHFSSVKPNLIPLSDVTIYQRVH